MITKLVKGLLLQDLRTIRRSTKKDAKVALFIIEKENCYRLEIAKKPGNSYAIVTYEYGSWQQHKNVEVQIDLIIDTIYKAQRNEMRKVGITW